MVIGVSIRSLVALHGIQSNAAGPVRPSLDANGREEKDGSPFPTCFRVETWTREENRGPGSVRPHSDRYDSVKEKASTLTFHPHSKPDPIASPFPSLPSPLRRSFLLHDPNRRLAKERMEPSTRPSRFESEILDPNRNPKRAPWRLLRIPIRLHEGIKKARRGDRIDPPSRRGRALPPSLLPTRTKGHVLPSLPWFLLRP